MDVTQVAMAMSQTQLMNNINVAVLAKNLDTVEEMGDGMIKMMEQSVNPNLGQYIDISV